MASAILLLVPRDEFPAHLSIFVFVFVVGLIAVGTFSGCTPSAESCEVKEAVIDVENALVRDADRVCSEHDGCVLVEDTCGCNNRGVRSAVASSQVAAVNARREAVPCPDQISQDVTCGSDVAATCIDGTCEVLRTETCAAQS